MAPALYQFTPLSSASSVRLLRLTDPIASQGFTESAGIELFEVPIEDAPAFEAVSYAWDHTDARLPLLCDGKQLEVSPDVLDMIMTLNLISTVRVFWVDAVCIDQSSTLDKNIQVPRMRFIFSKAQMVWVWLGQGTYESRLAFELLVQMNDLRIDKAQNEIHLAESWLDSLPRYQAAVRERRGVYDAVDTDFVIDIIQSPWFRRTWTIQEVALAKTARLVCGRATIDWISFLDVLKQLQVVYAGDTNSSNYRVLSNPATFFDDIRTHSMMTDVVRNRKSMQLSIALDLIRQNESTDPKDKIYGLYGIFDHFQIRRLPSVDYSGSVQRLYREMTGTVLRHDRSLHVLYMIGQHPRISGLPSWVPDYSNTDFIRFIHVYPHKASSRSRARFTLCDLHLSLSVSAVFVDEINVQASSTSICTADFRQGFAARPHLSNAAERHAAVTELVRTLRSWIVTSRSIECYPADEAPKAAFYKIMTQPVRSGSQNWPMPTVPTCTMDTFEQWMYVMTLDLEKDHNYVQDSIADIESDPISSAIVSDYIRLFGCSQDPRQWSAELQIRLLLRARNHALSTLQHDISLLSYQRTFFTTKDNYMGVGPRRMISTDRIALIAGLQLPFIVRKSGDAYNLIGPAYVHGIMKGERWDKELAEDITLV